MLKVNFCNEKPSGASLTYVVIAARYNGKWVLVRHRERDTYEVPGGHIETGEDYLAAAKREFHCVDEVDGKLFFSGSYYEIESFTFQKNGNPLTLYNRRVSDYINALSKAGFTVEQVVEETDKDTLNRDEEFTSGYYSSTKAKKFPLSIVIRARKI